MLTYKRGGNGVKVTVLKPATNDLLTSFPTLNSHRPLMTHNATKTISQHQLHVLLTISIKSINRNNLHRTYIYILPQTIWEVLYKIDIVLIGMFACFVSFLYHQLFFLLFFVVVITKHRNINRLRMGETPYDSLLIKARK